jgi:hypothetical protein
VLEHFRSIATFQVIQEESDRLRRPGSSRRRVRRLRAAGRCVNGSATAAVTDMRIEVEVTDAIERPKSNKHRFILSRVPAEGSAR